MTIWYFILSHNSNTPPCGGSNCTHVAYNRDGLATRTYGGYTGQTDDEIMNQILNPAVLQYDGVYYQLSDAVYVNGVLYRGTSNYIDIVIRPYSQYDPESAIAALVAKLSDINGSIINIFNKYGLLNYQYVNTEFIRSDPNVILRINLQYTGA